MDIKIEDLSPIFREVLENDDLLISESTVAADVPEWDSLNHIYLVVAIEKQFKVKFTTHQIQSWKCVGDILTDLNK
jgi:acyl carrier protein